MKKGHCCPLCIQDALELLDILSMEEKYSKQVKLEMKVLEEAEKAAKIKNKEKLIDDLMFGEADANQILADHRWTGDGTFLEWRIYCRGVRGAFVATLVVKNTYYAGQKA